MMGSQSVTRQIHGVLGCVQGLERLWVLLTSEENLKCHEADQGIH